MPILVLLTSMPNGIEFLQGKEPPLSPPVLHLLLLLLLFVDRAGKEGNGREDWGGAVDDGEDMR